MNIRTAEDRDLNAVLSLWKETFHEDERFDEWFFFKEYKAENTLVLCDGGEIRSMLQMIPVTVLSNGKELKASYIYGAATDVRYRSRGYMGKLLSASFEEGRRRGDRLSVLIPQEKSLFDYYGRFSYYPAFSISKRSVSISEISFAEEGGKNVAADASKWVYMNEIYEKNLVGTAHIKRSPEIFASQIDLFSKTGGRVSVLQNGGEVVAYAFAYKNGESLVVQEAMGKTEGYRNECILNIMKETGICTAEVWEAGCGAPFGCARVVGEDADPEMHTIRGGYMNLLFN